MAAASPILVPGLLVRNRRFRANSTLAAEKNHRRIESAEPIELPELERFELTVLVEHKVEDGFLGAPGVSYWIKTDRGSVLLDVGFGAERPALLHNARRLGFSLADVEAVVISHLHRDHMGGAAAAKAGQVRVPVELGDPRGMPCFVPAPATAPGFALEVVEGPRVLGAGIGTTGPLSRSLFMLGMVEEQAIVARLRGKGLVVLTGCGHPTIATILAMVRRAFGEPIHAIGGGLHFPITASSMHAPGLEVQMILGTGKPPWQRLTDDDLTRTIADMREVRPERLLLSGHDTCDHALARFAQEVGSETHVLAAGSTWAL